MTTRDPKKRISDTTNPDYTLYHSYQIAADNPNELRRVESTIHRELVKAGIVRRKFENNKNSEWFKCKPEIADQICAEVIGKVKTKKQQELAREAAREKAKHEESLRKMEIDKKLDKFKGTYGPVLKALEQKASEHQALLDKNISAWKVQQSTYKPNFFEWTKYLYTSIASSFVFALLFCPFTFAASLVQDSYRFTEMSLVIFFLILLCKIFIRPSEAPFKKQVDNERINRMISSWSNQSVLEEIRLTCRTAKNYELLMASNNVSEPSPPAFTIDELNRLLSTNLILAEGSDVSTDNKFTTKQGRDENSLGAIGRFKASFKSVTTQRSDKDSKSSNWDWLIIVIILLIISSVVKHI